MNDLNKAKSLLNGDLTCVLVKGDKILTFRDSGIAPVIKVLESGTDVKGFSACDKIVGKAAAMLFVLLGVKAVHGVVMSSTGKEVLQKHNIKASCGTLVEKIINRAGTDICPMEKTVQFVDDPQEAYTLLKQKLATLANKKQP